MLKEKIKDILKNIIPMDISDKTAEKFTGLILSAMVEDELKDIPMGVSQWRNHGKKWGYWEFFKKEK